jgi:arylsulfatase A-like enzyme
MRVPLLIAGAGVRVGAVPRDARLVDVAPTIAALLGARPPADAQGRALAESLNV